MTVPSSTPCKKGWEHSYELADMREGPFLESLHKIIRISVKVLAVLMVAVIIWGIGDVVYVLNQRLVTLPFLLLSILATSWQHLIPSLPC